jgi:hypothetical protein
MSCPYNAQLDQWDGVYNPIGRACYNCQEWWCEHNANNEIDKIDEWEQLDEDTISLFAEGGE